MAGVGQSVPPTKEQGTSEKVFSAPLTHIQPPVDPLRHLMNYVDMGAETWVRKMIYILVM